jgi:hypothetical protein
MCFRELSSPVNGGNAVEIALMDEKFPIILVKGNIH